MKKNFIKVEDQVKKDWYVLQAPKRGTVVKSGPFATFKIALASLPSLPSGERITEKTLKENGIFIWKEV